MIAKQLRGRQILIDDKIKRGFLTGDESVGFLMPEINKDL